MGESWGEKEREMERKMGRCESGSVGEVGRKDWGRGDTDVMPLGSRGREGAGR